MTISMSWRTLLLSALAASPAWAQVQVNLTSSRDNTLYEDSTGALSNGAGSYFFAGKTMQNQIRRGLLRFNIAGAIPAGSTIVTADLTLDMSQAISGNVQVSLHRAQADWGEGTSVASGNEGAGAPATTNDATWVHRLFNTANWTTMGGDFAATASGTQTVGALGPYTWTSTAAMVADVQSWLDTPATNFGWLVRGDETTFTTAKRFATHENLNPMIHPRLAVTFRPPAARVTSTGMGCGAGPFTSSAVGLPSLGNAAFAVRAAGGPASGLSLLFLATALAPAPVPLGGGCNLYLNPIGLLLLLQVQGLDAAGAGTHPLPVPTDLSLVGVGLPTQLFGVNLSAPVTVLSSNALTLFIGG